MKRWILPGVLLVGALGAVAFLQHLQRRPGIGYAAPEFDLPDLKGNRHSLAEYRGKIVFLNLWATWCPPCREEMPAMERLYQKLEGRDFVMLAVSQDEQGAQAVAPFVRQMSLSFTVLLDPDASMSPRYGVTGYPETFIIDRDGRVIEHTIGPADWDTAAYVSYFTSLLDSKK